MTPRKIDFFFRTLDQKLRQPARVILVGASAGSLMGQLRPSVDIDFEIRLLKKSTPQRRETLDRVIREAAFKARVAVNYSEDIGRWSMVSFLDYRRKSTRYKKIGYLDIQLIAPDYWTIGKMSRFLELDIRDMIKIIRKKKLPAVGMARLWARAVRSSELCLELGQFREHVIYFLRQYGKKVWGCHFKFEKTTKEFLKNAR